MTTAAYDAVYFDDETETVEPSTLRVLFGGLAGGAVAAAGAALVWGLIGIATGYEFSIVALLAGAVTGAGVRAGAGRSGGLPAFLAFVMTYFAAAGALGMQVFYDFWSTGEVFGAVVAFPITVLAYIPALVMSGDILGLLFLAGAWYMAVKVCLDDGAGEYEQY